LKYQTDKAAEVGRLVASLGRLGRNMSGLPEQVEDGMIWNSMSIHVASGTTSLLTSENKQTPPCTMLR